VPSLPQAPRQRIALRRIWALLRPYWFSEDRWPGRGLLALVLGLNLGSVLLTVLLAQWNRRFYDALQGKDYPAFLSLLGYFTVLAASYITIVVFALYFAQMLQIRWRRWLTDQYTGDWLTGRAYYLLQLEPSHVENPEQRIQDDINIVANLTLDLLTGVLNAVVTLASFLVLLWTLSGTLRFHLAGLALAIPGYMVWVAILYAAVGSVATHLVGRRLIGINFDLQRADADFRFRMIRIRENAESVALYGGEPDEQEQLRVSFGHIWRTWWRLMKAQRRLTFFTAGYGQAATIFPVLVAAPRVTQLVRRCLPPHRPVDGERQPADRLRGGAGPGQAIADRGGGDPGDAVPGPRPGRRRPSPATAGRAEPPRRGLLAHRRWGSRGGERAVGLRQEHAVPRAGRHLAVRHRDGDDPAGTANLVSAPAAVHAHRHPSPGAQLSG
jgi:ABC-type long-subunit fatty acid transport system fused permease/ATPase subunit